MRPDLIRLRLGDGGHKDAAFPPLVRGIPFDEFLRFRILQPEIFVRQ